MIVSALSRRPEDLWGRRGPNPVIAFALGMRPSAAPCAEAEQAEAQQERRAGLGDHRDRQTIDVLLLDPRGGPVLGQRSERVAQADLDEGAWPVKTAAAMTASTSSSRVPVQMWVPLPSTVVS